MKSSLGTKITATAMAAALSLSLVACGSSESASGSQSSQAHTTSGTTAVSTQASTNSTEAANYTDRDMEQTADTSSAKTITLANDGNVDITEEGVYVITGTATNATIRVNADSQAKVQLVLDNANITNTSMPAIYVLSADKVFVTTTSGSTNKLEVTGTFAADGETSLDGVIFSKDDLVLNGLGTLSITSSDHGIVSKDDVKVTGGTYQLSVKGDAIQANDGAYVADGTLNITATTDGIQAGERAQIDGGTLKIQSAEGIESTYVQVNGGTIDITASDDGINATTKSETSTQTPTIEITGGDLTISMGAGDTDALDANGNIYISGGNVNITGQFAFDFDGQGELTGGTVTVNGEQITSLTNSMMGGGMGGHGGMGGQGQMGDPSQMDQQMGGQGGPMGGHGGQGGRQMQDNASGNTTNSNSGSSTSGKTSTSASSSVQA